MDLPGINQLGMKPVIQAIRGDITRIHVDAIVNAANERLVGGGGVDGAIHRAGGPEIMAECDRIRRENGGCPAGQAVLTTAGKLPAKAVIHTVGPIWRNGSEGEAELLTSCYLNSLQLAKSHGYETIAFPNISTGVFGFPKDLAAKIAVRTVTGFNSPAIKKILFVCFDQENFTLYKELLNHE